MYNKHFGLERRIFRGNAAAADVFVGPQTASILTGIKKALSGTDAVVTLTGPVGSGKSTAVAHSLSAISGKNAIVRVGRFPLQRGELLDLLFDHMRIQQRPQRGNQKLVLFRQLLFNLAQNDSRMFILVEDAPFLGPDMLAELEVVTAADTGPSDGAAIVLMGDEYLKELLASKSLARLRQRIRLRRTLEPCSVDELGGYLRHCLRQAGGDFDKIFADGATELLHELSGGILRVANNLVESSMEAAADANAGVVALELVSRIADEEFGLTGMFSRPPEISSKQPEPRHTDDATAELVALSMPEPEPAVTTGQSPGEDDIPELIQDTQPALAILNNAPAPAKSLPPKLTHDTLPDIEALSAELEETKTPEPAARQTTTPAPEPAAAKKPAAPPTDVSRSAPKPSPTQAVREEAKSGTKVRNRTGTAAFGKGGDETRSPTGTGSCGKGGDETRNPTGTGSCGKGGDETRNPTGTGSCGKGEDETRNPTGTRNCGKGGDKRPEKANEPSCAEPEFKLELELEPEADPAADATIPTLSDATGTVAAPAKDAATDHDTPDWDRDPTLAELRPDLDALERAMAVAQGRDAESGEDSVAAPEPIAEKKPQEDVEDIPQITLDDSINRKVDRAALERKQRLEEEGILEEEPAEENESGPTEEDRAREEKAAAELEKIAVGLAKAKSIEDVDDKMAETLFGEELSVAAAAVAARVAEEAAAAAAGQDSSASPPAGTTNANQSEMEKEFENVWGEKPDVEVSIETQIEDQKGGLDISASQRLATVRALSSTKPDAAMQGAAKPAPAVNPDPIEEQITTSLTQTMKALKVNPEPRAVNDDDDDERKGGFFSRFRRS
jgi:type II secretory pathway predicted ATPase ExeA